MRQSRQFLVALAVLVTVSLIAACGSSSSDGTTNAIGTSNAAQQAAVRAARATVIQYEKVQPPVQVPALTKPVPKDVRLAVLTCALPICEDGTNPAMTAGEKLGWSVYQTQIQATPTSYVDGWNAVLARNPTAIIYIPFFSSSVAAAQIAEAHRRHIILVAMSYNTPTLAASGTTYAVDGVPEVSVSGKLMGDIIVADAGGPTNVVFVTDPTRKYAFAPVQSAFMAAVTPAGVNVQTLDVSSDDIGASMPGEIVNYLQSHPDNKYVVLALADFSEGLPEALSSVGLAGRVKIVSRAPEASDLAEIKSGAEFASVTEEVVASGYRAVDDIIRLASGQQPVDANPAGWHQIMVAGNITQTSTLQPTPGVPEVLYTAWGVS